MPHEVLVELEALQEHIAEFIRSVLICLSTIESEDTLRNPSHGPPNQSLSSLVDIGILSRIIQVYQAGFF